MRETLPFLLSDYIWCVYCCRSLQGEGNHGFDVLLHSFKYQTMASKELAEYIKERCVICLSPSLSLPPPPLFLKFTTSVVASGWLVTACVITIVMSFIVDVVCTILLLCSVMSAVQYMYVAFHCVTHKQCMTFTSYKGLSGYASWYSVLPINFI